MAGISISMLSGDNSILQKATDAKNITGVGQEKETIALAYNSTLAKKVSNSDSTPVTASDLNTELANQGASADGSNPIKVTFNASKRQYTVNSNGIIEYAGIKNGNDETVSTSNVYATVCANGTLIFSNNEADINKYLTDNNTTLANGYSIEDITNDIYLYAYDEENDVDISNLPSWDGDSNIENVSFLNEISPKNTANWFDCLTNLTSFSNSQEISNFNTSNVTDMNGMFAECSSLTNLNLSSFNTSNVTDMSNMFFGCSSLTNLNLSSFNTGNVTNMNNMFNECSTLTTLDVSMFTTSKVTDMQNMFYGCSNLETLNLGNFDTSAVTTIMSMFTYCPKLITIYASSSFVLPNTASSEFMFLGDEALIGGSGTVYDYSKLDATYARIDGENSNPGYFTRNTN